MTGNRKQETGNRKQETGAGAGAPAGIMIGKEERKIPKLLTTIKRIEQILVNVECLIIDF